MPTISKFYGLTIRMYFLPAEHHPPHIHVIYGEHAAAMEIRTGIIIEGELPVRAQNLAKEWLVLHKEELITMWESQDIKALPPLE